MVEKNVKVGVGSLDKARLIVLDHGDFSKHEDEIMRLEEIFHENIRFDKEYKKNEMTKEGAIALLVELDGRIIAEAYGSPLSTLRGELREDNTEHVAFADLFARFRGKSKNVFYLMSYGILPKFQRYGIGKELVEEILKRAKAEGFEFVAMHAREGASLQINQKLGAQVLDGYPNWYDTGETNYLCIIPLK